MPPLQDEVWIYFIFEIYINFFLERQGDKNMQTFLHSFSVRNIKNKHLRCSTGQEAANLVLVPFTTFRVHQFQSFLKTFRTLWKRQHRV